MGCPKSSACVFAATVERSIVKRVRYSAAYPYCRGGRHDECALYIALGRGESVPHNLMPDGSVSDYLEEGASSTHVRGANRFLVVDDSPVFATIAANSIRLRYPNAQVVQCHSFDEAAQELAAGRFTLIVSGNGLGGGKTFQDIRRLSLAPMVLFTGWPPAETDVPDGCRVVKKDAGPDALSAAITSLVGA